MTISYSSISLSVLSWALFFFFSSRRRHTRYWRDWSSDVCSSDLGREGWSVRVVARGSETLDTVVEHPGQLAAQLQLPLATLGPGTVPVEALWQRSEERRAGKECRSRGSPDH